MDPTKLFAEMQERRFPTRCAPWGFTWWLRPVMVWCSFGTEKQLYTSNWIQSLMWVLWQDYYLHPCQVYLLNTNILLIFIIIVFHSYGQGRVCGLCGNYDGNANNDFTTRSQAIAVDALDFVNSWKLSSCPDATLIQEPCVHNPYREAWAQRQCSIITSNVFSTCHSQVLTTNCYLGNSNIHMLSILCLKNRLHLPATFLWILL